MTARAPVGASGRQLVDALVREEGTPQTRAEWAKGCLRAKIPALRLALDGRVPAYHRLLIRELLEHLAYLERSLQRAEVASAEQREAHAAAVNRLATLPAAGPTSLAAILGEIGTARTRFASADQLASWAGRCPGNQVSAGKRLGGKATHGHQYLRTILGELAWTDRADAGDLPVRPVPPLGTSPRQEPSDSRGRAPPPQPHLPYAARPPTVPRSGSGLLRALGR